MSSRARLTGLVALTAGIVSGHTLKHLAAAAAGGMLLHHLRRRRSLAADSL